MIPVQLLGTGQEHDRDICSHHLCPPRAAGPVGHKDEKKAKGLGRKEVKEEFPGGTVVYTENLKESTDMSLKLRCDFHKVADQGP